MSCLHHPSFSSIILYYSSLSFIGHGYNISVPSLHCPSLIPLIIFWSYIPNIRITPTASFSHYLSIIHLSSLHHSSVISRSSSSHPHHPSYSSIIPLLVLLTHSHSCALVLFHTLSTLFILAKLGYWGQARVCVFVCVWFIKLANTLNIICVFLWVLCCVLIRLEIWILFQIPIFLTHFSVLSFLTRTFFCRHHYKENALNCPEGVDKACVWLLFLNHIVICLWKIWFLGGKKAWEESDAGHSAG